MASGFRVSGLGFWGFRASGFRVRASGVVFRVLRGLREKGLGL